MAGIAARRYVKALYEFALENNAEQQVQPDLEKLQGLLQESEELYTALLNPSYGREDKLAIFNQVSEDLSLGEPVAGVMRLLIRKSRVELLDGIVEEYADQQRQRQGIISMELKTARPLDDAVQQEIKQQFEQSTGKQVDISATVDTALIGGMVARIGGTIYDGSIEHQLNLIKQRLGE